MEFIEELTLTLKASAPITQIISHDTLRIRAFVEYAAKNLGRSLYIWNRTQGLSRIIKPDDDNIEYPIAMDSSDIIMWFSQESDNEVVEPNADNCVVLLEDFHPDLDDSRIINRLRNFVIAVAGKQIKNVSVILSQPIQYLPVELEKDTHVLTLPMPGLEALEIIVEQAKQHYNIAEQDYKPTEELLSAALGLATSEAQFAFARVACAKNRITATEIPLIVKEKEQVIRKNGHLEYFHPSANLDDIGGLGRLKSWLKRRKLAFTADAKRFGLEYPRGVLLLGIPGTGKSLAAKAVANAWELPLLRLDMGKIYGGIVGQSEANMHQALQLAEALSPSILWVDEIEKGLSGMQSSGTTDGGTTARVLGTFLTWMQEKEKPVFVVATANDIGKLPPELLRKGRMDEIFFVDLPNQAERIDILRVHLRKRNARDKNFNEEELATLAELAKGFTGAELEEAIKEAMFVAFDDANSQDLRIDHIKDAIKETTPLSSTMREIITDMREWIKGRAVYASSGEPEPITSQSEEKGTKLRLRNEFENPFSSSKE